MSTFFSLLLFFYATIYSHTVFFTTHRCVYIQHYKYSAGVRTHSIVVYDNYNNGRVNNAELTTSNSAFERKAEIVLHYNIFAYTCRISIRGYCRTIQTRYIVYDITL